MTEPTDWPGRWAAEPYCYVTTTGRRTGRPHTIEIWFAAHDGRVYMLSGGRDRADWVRNLQADPRVQVRLRGETRAGTARVVRGGTAEDALARRLLVAKYAGEEEGSLEDWGRTALPVAVDFPAAAP